MRIILREVLTAVIGVLAMGALSAELRASEIAPQGIFPRETVHLGALRPFTCSGTDCTLAELAGLYVKVGGQEQCSPMISLSLGPCGDASCLWKKGYVDPKTYEGATWYQVENDSLGLSSAAMHRDRDTGSLTFNVTRFDGTILKPLYDSDLQLSDFVGNSYARGIELNCLYERHHDGAAQ